MTNSKGLLDAAIDVLKLLERIYPVDKEPDEMYELARQIHRLETRHGLGYWFSNYSKPTY